MSEIDRIVRQVEKTFDKQPWYGNATTATLSNNVENKSVYIVSWKNSYDHLNHIACDFFEEDFVYSYS
ncbi:MAG: hypothetical protein ORN54_11075 [Cyclobacteriaceae bacterium]|nr:hypothetical protein [Cyclobacteriaceae bacterium]